MFNSAFLCDLLDDLSPLHMTSLLNWLAVNNFVASRANIRKWRAMNLHGD